MKKSDINNAMLFKFGSGDMAVLLWREDHKERVFYNISQIKEGNEGGITGLDELNEDLMYSESTS